MTRDKQISARSRAGYDDAAASRRLSRAYPVYPVLTPSTPYLPLRPRPTARQPRRPRAAVGARGDAEHTSRFARVRATSSLPPTPPGNKSVTESITESSASPHPLPQYQTTPPSPRRVLRVLLRASRALLLLTLAGLRPADSILRYLRGVCNQSQIVRRINDIRRARRGFLLNTTRGADT